MLPHLVEMLAVKKEVSLETKLKDEYLSIIVIKPNVLQVQTTGALTWFDCRSKRQHVNKSGF